MFPILCIASAENLEEVSRDFVAIKTVEDLSYDSIASIHEVSFKSAGIVSSATHFINSE